jgi:hypothetical protein
MSHPFSYAELHSQDPGRALEFYRRLFDWPSKTSDTPMGPYHELEPGEGFPGGIMTAAPGAASCWVVYVRVPDVAAATDKAEGLGARVLARKQHVPDVGWFSLCADPTGATFGLWEPMPGKKS